MLSLSTFCHYQVETQRKISQRERKNKSIPRKDKKNIQKHKTAWCALRYNSQNKGEAAETGS